MAGQIPVPPARRLPYCERDTARKNRGMFTRILDSVNRKGDAFVSSETQVLPFRFVEAWAM